MSIETITREDLMLMYYTQEVLEDPAVRYDYLKKVFMGQWPVKYVGSLLCHDVEFCKNKSHMLYPEIHGKAQDWAHSATLGSFFRTLPPNIAEQEESQAPQIMDQDREEDDPNTLDKRDDDISFYFQVRVPDDLVTRIKESASLSTFEEVTKDIRERPFPEK